MIYLVVRIESRNSYVISRPYNYNYGEPLAPNMNAIYTAGYLTPNVALL